MKITLESTDRIVIVNGAKARVWEGQTATGIPIFAAIATIAVHRQEDNSEFERDLTEHKASSRVAAEALPLRFFLD